MAVGETMITVVGNVSSDLTRRTLSGGDEVTSFWLRSNERRYDKDAGVWRDGRHFSVRVTCWRRMAETVGESLNRGDPVIVRGRLHTNEYEADRQRKVIPQVEAIAIGPNLAWCRATVRRPGRMPGTGERAGEVGAVASPSALADQLTHPELAGTGDPSPDSSHEQVPA